VYYGRNRSPESRHRQRIAPECKPPACPRPQGTWWEFMLVYSGIVKSLRTLRAQQVDATPSNQLIGKYFLSRTHSSAQ
jgi:hypothetical protein